MIKYAVYIAIIMTIIVMILLVIKWRKEKKKMGCIGYGYFFLIVVTLNMLFFPFAAILLEKVYTAVTNPSYVATIVDSRSYTDECEDSEGHTYTCKKYVSIVTFQLENGKTIRSESNIHSTESPTIGDTVRVVYVEGAKNVDELSVVSIGMYIALAMMLFLMGMVLLMGINYTLGKSNETLLNMLIKFVLYILFPLGIIGLLVGMAWFLWQYFIGVKEAPLWVVALCSFFVTVLLLSIYGYLNLLFKKEKKKFD